MNSPRLFVGSVIGVLVFILGVGACGPQSLTGGHPTGSGGTSGTGGAGGSASDAGTYCAELVSRYSAALLAAESCDVGANGECDQEVAAGLSVCGSCGTFVHDPSTLNALSALWAQAGCGDGKYACPLIECPPALNNVCVASDGGRGLCSYSPIGAGGSGGGTAGSGGGSGAGGSAGDAGLSVCGDLQSQYAAALSAARSCDIGGTAQCQQLVAESLSPCLNNCKTYVNDTTTLDPIAQRWQAAGCGNVVVLCPAIACLQPTSGICVATDGGGASCSTTSSGPPPPTP